MLRKRPRPFRLSPVNGFRHTPSDIRPRFTSSPKGLVPRSFVRCWDTPNLRRRLTTHRPICKRSGTPSHDCHYPERQPSLDGSATRTYLRGLIHYRKKTGSARINTASGAHQALAGRLANSTVTDEREPNQRRFPATTSPLGTPATLALSISPEGRVRSGESVSSRPRPGTGSHEIIALNLPFAGSGNIRPTIMEPSRIARSAQMPSDKSVPSRLRFRRLFNS
jgi:hypothetical protein